MFRKKTLRKLFQSFVDTLTLPNPGNGKWTIRLNDNNDNGKQIAYASFIVSDFCVRIKSGPDQNLCSINNHKAEDWAGSELKVIFKETIFRRFHPVFLFLISH